jgi:hypothetical protein
MSTNTLSEQIAASESKSTFIERLGFALVPLLFSCLVYLMNDLNNLTHRVTILEGKIRVVVTDENKVVPQAQAELAREKLRQDFLAGETQALIRHEENRSAVSLLSWRVMKLEEKNEKK